MNSQKLEKSWLDFEKYADSLMPAIAQDAKTWTVLMVGFANPEALRTTLETGLATFWSRSRNELWTKGLTSGDVLEVRSIYTDCDNDTLIYVVETKGKGACHIDGWKSCFRRRIDALTGQILDTPEDPPKWSNVSSEEQSIIETRSAVDPNSSFTAKLAQGSWGKLLGKLAEEAFEASQAVLMDEGRERVISELADVDYVTRIIVAKINATLESRNEEPVTVEEVEAEIVRRRK